MPARLDQALVARGLARSRTHAAALIAEGKVSSAGQVLAKASLQVEEDKPLEVDHDERDTYVSRAGHKLAGALDAFPEVQPEGKRCLDRRFH
jgi:23S rRNA (cytidine1920-2'-O)/16S rRNA (cytidine1409-2'-O)-methyltransferase